MKKIVLFLLFLFLYQDLMSQENESHITNPNTPRYTEEDFLTLTEKYSIDVLNYEKYEISAVTFIDADDNGNLYVLSIMDSKIFVFDSLGKFVKELGGSGQGPRELMKPLSLSVKDNRIYIHEQAKGVKIWNLEGKYIDFILFAYTNRRPVIKPYNDYFLISYFEYEGNPLETGEWIKHCYHSIFDLELKKISDINEIVVDTKKVFSYTPNYMSAIDSDDNIYTPDSPDIYKINKYSKDGEFLFSFGREYKRIKYTKKVKDWYQETYGKNQKKFAPNLRRLPEKLEHYPPIVRHIMVDGRDNIWVVVGEWYGDNNCMYEIISTVDIFSSEGEFLYTFKTNKIITKSFIKNNVLYCKPRGLHLRTEKEDSYLKVYTINYKKQGNDQ